jgi:LPXTG-motif cell wall-anchored protein
VQATVYPGTPSALPTTGIGDEIGLPGLFGIAVVLLAVIFLVRRMRANTH